jgi:hypothetical protein
MKPADRSLALVILLVVLFRIGVWSYANIAGSGLPVNDKGLHVLIVEETADRGKLPLSQSAIFTSAPLAQYLDQNAHDWRVFDQNIDLVDQPDKWKRALEAAQEPPYIVIWNGNRGTKGPLPLTVDAVIDAVEDYK